MITKLSPLALLIISLLLFSCNANRYFGIHKEQYKQHQEAAKVFWQWMEENHTKVQADAEGEKQIATELKKYKQGIGISLQTNNKAKELILTAGGNKELLPFIDILYKERCKIDHWTFTKYLQPSAIPDSLSFESTTLHSGDFEIYADYKKESLLLIVALDDEKIVNVSNKILVQQFVVHSIGEENVMRHIHGIKFIRTGMIDDKFQSFNIHELKQAFESYFPTRN